MIIDPYRFAAAFPAPTAFFASDPMLSTAWGQVTYPAAIYVASSDKTYVSWQFCSTVNSYKGVHVAAYDHATQTWGERVSVGNFQLADDDHGDAVLLRDADGYIHCFFGSHANAQKWSVTNAADDISAWTQRADIGSALSYPKPVLVGSTIYLFARNDASLTNRKMGLHTLTPSSGVGTWSALSNIVDFGASSRVYIAEAHAVGTDIHIVCGYSNDTDTVRRGVYYFVYDTVTGAVKNYNTSSSVASGSLPVTKVQADANFRIYDHGSNDGDLASFQFDTSGNAHVIFADGASSVYDLKHMMLSGGSWSSATTVASLTDWQAGGFVDNYCLVRGASGKMEAWYNASNGDKMRSVRSAAGTWATAETIKAAGTYDLLQATAVKDADPSLRMFFAENSGTTTDSGAVNLSMFAYGDSGPVNDAVDMTAVDPAGFSNVTLLLGANHRDTATRIIDESKLTIPMTFSGNAQIDTAQSPFAGRGSILLDGTGDFVTAINSTAYSVAGTTDFCIDGWLRINVGSRLQAIMAKRASGTAHEFAFYVSASNQLQMIMFNGATTVLNITGTTAMSTGVWYYFECSRISSVTRLFLGTAEGTTTLEASGTQSSAPTTNSQALLIGRDVSNTTRDFNGWLSELRFTLGAGRHSSTFSVPSTPHPRR